MEGFKEQLSRTAKEIKGLGPFRMVEETVNGFQHSLPLIQNLKSDSLRERHWLKLMELTGKTFDMNPRTFTLGSLFELNLDQFEDDIMAICGGALKELNIESGINAIADTWRLQRFDVVKYFKGPQERGLILKATDEITQTLEDQMMNLSSMMSSRFVAPFLEQTKKWEGLMSTISEVIDVWMKVQAKWQYLEAIFVGSEDIRLQLPEEAKRFDRIHTAFKKIMSETFKNPNVLDSCTADGRCAAREGLHYSPVHYSLLTTGYSRLTTHYSLLATRYPLLTTHYSLLTIHHSLLTRYTALEGLFAQLEACQKSLSDYLETKRTTFPRFYFLSDDELLQILGTSDPVAVQEHMLKLFDNTAALTFDRTATKVLGMVSSEKETFEFRTPQLTDGAVEQWLGLVEGEMITTLRRTQKESTFHYPKSDRVEWVKSNLGLMVNTGAQVWWTYEVGDVFGKVRNGVQMP